MQPKLSIGSYETDLKPKEPMAETSVLYLPESPSKRVRTPKNSSIHPIHESAAASHVTNVPSVAKNLACAETRRRQAEDLEETSLTMVLANS